MKTTSIIEGLTILAKYQDEDGWDMGAEHDTIYAYATARPLSDDDLKRMVYLGWSQEVDTGDADFNSTHYDVEESWCANV